MPGWLPGVKDPYPAVLRQFERAGEGRKEAWTETRENGVGKRLRRPKGAALWNPFSMESSRGQ